LQSSTNRAGVANLVDEHVPAARMRPLTGGTASCPGAAPTLAITFLPSLALLVPLYCGYDRSSAEVY